MYCNAHTVNHPLMSRIFLLWLTRSCMLQLSQLINSIVRWAPPTFLHCRGNCISSIRALVSCRRICSSWTLIYGLVLRTLWQSLWLLMPWSTCTRTLVDYHVLIGTCVACMLVVKICAYEKTAWLYKKVYKK